jgi:hypothetical protein
MKLKIAAVLLLAGVSASVFADMNAQMATDRAALQANKRALIMRAMALDDKSSSTFWPLYDQYQKAKQAINDKSLALIQDYAKNYQSMTDEKALEITNRWVAIQGELAKTREDFLKKFTAALPGRTVARFFQADNKLDTFVYADIAQQIPLIPTAEAQAAAKGTAPAAAVPATK